MTNIFRTIALELGRTLLKLASRGKWCGLRSLNGRTQ